MNRGIVLRAPRLPSLDVVRWVAVTAGSVVTGIGLAAAPFLVMGAAVGTALMVFALMQPLAVVTLMLVVGPADLSIITGGFKGMFTQYGGLDMNGIRLLAMSAALCLVVLVERNAGRQVFRSTGIFYALLIAYGAVSLVYTPSVMHGSRLLLKIAYPLLVFLIIAGMTSSRQQLDRLMDWVLIGTVVLCVVVNPLYHLFGDFERDIGGWTRLRGIGVHQNPFAFYLLAAMLMSFVRFMTRRQWRYVVLCVICGFWMVLTIARIAFAASLVALLAVGIVSAIVAGQKRMLIAAIAVAVLLAIPFAPPVLARTLGYVPTPRELLSLIMDPVALVAAMNWEGRMLFWVVVYGAFLSSPIFGLGMGASSAILAEKFPIFQNAVVHNDYLRLLSDAGLLGLLLFGLALGTWLLAAIRATQLNDRTLREYALPAIGCIAAFAIVGITDNAFDYYGQFTQYVGFLSGGVVAGMMCLERERSAPAVAASPEPVPAVAARRFGRRW